MSAGQTGVEVKAGFFPLAFFLFSCTPRIEIDGTPNEKPWGTHFFPLAPGTHRIRIYFKYMFMAECGANSIDIQVVDGHVVRVSYYMPPLMLAKGSIKQLM
jgi:hypothetical protein